MQFLTLRRTRRNAPSVRLTPGRNTVNEHRDYHDTLRTLSRGILDRAPLRGVQRHRLEFARVRRPRGRPKMDTPRGRPLVPHRLVPRALTPGNNGGLPGFGSHL